MNEKNLCGFCMILVRGLLEVEVRTEAFAYGFLTQIEQLGLYYILNRTTLIYMTETNVTRTVNTQQVPGATVQQEQVSTSNQVDPQVYGIAKANQVIWFFAHLVAIILALRFVFLVLGANLTGIVLFIYNISSIFVLPFRGIFPAPRTGEFYLDTAALLAIALYYLLAFILTKAVALFSHTAEV